MAVEVGGGVELSAAGSAGSADDGRAEIFDVGIDVDAVV